MDYEYKDKVSSGDYEYPEPYLSNSLEEREKLDIGLRKEIKEK